MYCDWPDLGRCCFCMPLRRGVLTFGYIHIFFSAFMVGIYSYSIQHADEIQFFIQYGKSISLPSELCVTFYCFEVIFDGVLIYGAHKKILQFIKAFYYYTMMTCVAMLIMQLVDVAKIDNSYMVGSAIEMCILAFADLCLQIYLLTLVRSLIRKMETSGPHMLDNPLQQIVSGESNGIYNNTTVIPTHV